MGILKRPLTNQFLEKTEKERGRRAALLIQYPGMVERLERNLGRTATVSEIESALYYGIPETPPARPSPLEFHHPDEPALILNPLATTMESAPERGVLGLGVINLDNWPLLRNRLEKEPSERAAIF